MVDGTDEVTELHGIGSRTASRIEGETVREFVVGRTDVSVVSSREHATANAVRNADIDTFDDAPTEADVLLAQLATAQKMHFEPRRQRQFRRRRQSDDPDSIDSFDGAYTSPMYMYAGDPSPTSLRNYPQYSTQPNGIMPAFLKTGNGNREAVYIVSEDQGPYARPNERVRDPSGPTDTIIPAWCIESVAEVLDRTPSDMLNMMRFEQDSPLLISDDSTGFSVMIAASVVDERSDEATSHAQEEGHQKDPTQYELDIDV